MIDEKTMTYYHELKSRGRERLGTPLPELLCDTIVEEDNVWFPELFRLNIKRGIRGKDLYNDWFRCLAYMIYGYGNLSNNDRQRNGQPTKRWRC